MFLITSGAYIGDEFASELGLLPPSFLPLGNRCLYEYQTVLAEQLSEQVCLSIPASFELSECEQAYIGVHNVELIRVPEGLSLGQSILYCLNMIRTTDETLQILHGDTLFKDLPMGSDLISISPNTGFYHRAIINADGTADALLQEQMAVDGDVVASGYFSFSCTRSLIRHLTLQQGNFVEALNAYHCHQPLTAVSATDWFDFGHINAYFGSRAAFTTERSFNELEMSKSTVRKASHKAGKMRGEAGWFAALPTDIQIYTPKLISTFDEQDRAGYTLEYLYNLPLSDLFVFGRLTKEAWRCIFQSCQRFLQRCEEVEISENKPAPATLDDLYLPKTLARLEEFAASSDIDIEAPLQFNGQTYPSPRSLAERSNQWITPATDKEIGVVHGDFCFSNILYDFRTRRIKVIDPRGVNLQGDATLYGDIRYDYAKLYHSVYGLYDLIVSGRLRAVRTDAGLELQDFWHDYHQGIGQAFDDVLFANRPQLRGIVKAIGIQLFLSMLPLHSDRPDRQITMLANAYRLYAELNGEPLCS